MKQRKDGLKTVERLASGGLAHSLRMKPNRAGLLREDIQLPKLPRLPQLSAHGFGRVTTDRTAGLGRIGKTGASTGASHLPAARTTVYTDGAGSSSGQGSLGERTRNIAPKDYRNKRGFMVQKIRKTLSTHFPINLQNISWLVICMHSVPFWTLCFKGISIQRPLKALQIRWKQWQNDIKRYMMTVMRKSPNTSALRLKRRSSAASAQQPRDWARPSPLCPLSGKDRLTKHS